MAWLCVRSAKDTASAEHENLFYYEETIKKYWCCLSVLINFFISVRLVACMNEGLYKEIFFGFSI